MLLTKDIHLTTECAKNNQSLTHNKILDWDTGMAI